MLIGNVGGAPLPWVEKPVAVVHGCSESEAICRAIQLAYRIAEQDSSLADFNYCSIPLIFKNLKKK